VEVPSPHTNRCSHFERILRLNFSEIAGACKRFRAKWVKIRSGSAPKA
jgi:hypothetical protein